MPSEKVEYLVVDKVDKKSLVENYRSLDATEAGESANFSDNLAKTCNKWYGAPLVSQIGSLAVYNLL